ncbi:PREDICTED: zinc finger [Prunus dulcis]|uniref:PREDICTED: zinc finger n=1 Tax=Prunus dulcis TaxID=3755 RepID=A0A5E4FCX9_PRUDU|nr:PREDICTED: zinc finger [Prunus dulcis]
MLTAPIGLPNPDVPSNAELSDLDLAILEEIRKLDALLDKIRKLDPALLDKIRKFDPDVLDELRKIDPVLLDGLRKIHPTLLDELRKVDPAVLQEMQLEPAEWDPAIIGGIRKLYLKLREEDEEVAERSACSGRQTAKENENGNQKTQSEETDGGGGGENKNDNGSEVMKIGEERSRSQHYPVRPEAGEGKTGRKNRKNRKNNQNYFRSGGQHPNLYASPNPGNDDVLSPNPGKVDTVLQVDPAELDPAIIDAISKFSLKGKEEGEQEVEVSCSRPETEIRNKNGNKRQSEERDGGGGVENKNENGGQVEKKVDDERSRRHHYPVRPPGAGDSSHNLKTGTHKFGSNCKFNRTRGSKNNQVSKDKMKEREGLAEKPGQTECKNYFRSGGQCQNRYAPQNPGDNDSFSPNSDVPPNPGNDGVLPQNPGKDDILPPNHGDTDCDLATLREILRHKTALLGIIRKLDAGLFGDIQKIDPAVLREMQADPAEWDPAIIDAICKLSLEEKDESEEEVEVSCGGPETEIRNENRYKTQSEERDGGGGENKNENGGEVQKKVDEERSRRHHYPVRPPGAGDSLHNLKTGTHQFGSNCKFNLTRRSKNNQVSKNKMKEREGLAEKPGKTECKVSKNKMKEREGLAEKPGKTECKNSFRSGGRHPNLYTTPNPGNDDVLPPNSNIPSNLGNDDVFPQNPGDPDRENGNGNETQSEERDKERSRIHHYPVRFEAGDCWSYLKTGTCNFGPSCKFNHPHRRKNDQNYFRSGGCKPGKAFSFNPRRGEPSVAPVQELNFMDLPICPGEKECPYYMKNGSCKSGTNCTFNHPDPTAIGESGPPSGYIDGGPASVQGASSATAWDSLCVPMIPPSQGISCQNTEWNASQDPEYLPERSIPAPPPYVMNKAVTETNIYEQNPQQKQVEEFPERPGQPICIYFLRKGDCKNRSNCKYHHPKNQTAVPPSCALSDKGLPLRPGENICTQYSSYGICNSGPACKFDHPSLSTFLL